MAFSRRIIARSMNQDAVVATRITVNVKKTPLLGRVVNNVHAKYNMLNGIPLSSSMNHKLI